MRAFHMGRMEDYWFIFYQALSIEKRPYFVNAQFKDVIQDCLFLNRLLKTRMQSGIPKEKQIVKILYMYYN